MLGLVSLGWALLVDILQMKDIASIGLEHTIFTWNIAHAGNIVYYMHLHNTGNNKQLIFQLFAGIKHIVLIGRRTAVMGLLHFEHQTSYFLLYRCDLHYSNFSITRTFRPNLSQVRITLNLCAADDGSVKLKSITVKCVT